MVNPYWFASSSTGDSTLSSAYRAIGSGYETCDEVYTPNGNTINGKPVFANNNGAYLYWSGYNWNIGLSTSSAVYFSIYTNRDSTLHSNLQTGSLTEVSDLPLP
jgi:hypothetical protein